MCSVQAVLREVEVLSRRSYTLKVSMAWEQAATTTASVLASLEFQVRAEVLRLASVGCAVSSFVGAIHVSLVFSRGIGQGRFNRSVFVCLYKAAWSTCLCFMFSTSRVSLGWA